MSVTKTTDPIEPDDAHHPTRPPGDVLPPPLALPKIDYARQQPSAIVGAAFISKRIYITLFICWAVIAAVSNWLVPRMATIFQDFGIRLPASTRVLISIAKPIREHMLWIPLLPLLMTLAMCLSLLTWRETKLGSARRRSWAFRIIFSLLLLFITFVTLSLLLPMATLMNAMK